MFKKYTVTILNEKWELISDNVKLSFIPRTHELIFLDNLNKYFRVVNVIHKLKDKQNIFIIIEEYTDDFALLDKKNL